MGLPGVLRPLEIYFEVKGNPLSKKFHEIKGSVIENLFVDFNQFLYQAFYAVAGITPENFTLKEQFVKHLTKALREEMIMEEALRLFELSLKNFNITNLLYIAIDGTAPAAKMNQQRQRRWRSAYKKKSGPEDKFDTASFTSGTPFMKKFEERMKKWISEKGMEFASIIIYDGHLTPGEGEHKIMLYLRKHAEEIKGINVIYGMDADLFMLSLVSPVDKIWLVRENFNAVLYVDKFRDAIHQQFRINEDFDAEDYTQSLQDFILIMSIFGSDFYPKPISLTDTNTVMEHLFQKRTVLKKPITKRDGSFSVEALIEILKAIPEEDLLLEKATKEFIFPDPFLQECAVTEEINAGTTNVQVIGKSLNFNKYRTKWYSNLLKTTASVNPNVSLKAEDGSEKTPHQYSMMVSDVVKEYLTGFAWMFRYYTQGKNSVSQTWFYPYTHAPLIKDIILSKYHYDALTIHYRDKTPVNPVIALLTVLPPKSSILISSINMRNFMKDPDLSDFYKEQFIIQRFATNEEWHGVAIIAPADVKRVEAVIANKIFEKKFYESSLASATVDLNPVKPIQYKTGRSTEQFLDLKRKQTEMLEAAALEEKRIKAELELQKQKRERQKKENKEKGFFKEGTNIKEGVAQNISVRGGRGRGSRGGRGRGRGSVQKEKEKEEKVKVRVEGRGRGKKSDVELEQHKITDEDIIQSFKFRQDTEKGKGTYIDLDEL